MEHIVTAVLHLVEKFSSFLGTRTFTDIQGKDPILAFLLCRMNPIHIFTPYIFSMKVKLSL
jgi:hypothetical protein